MKSVGADIRVVNIGKSEASDLIRAFLDSNEMKLEKDADRNKKAVSIRAYKQIDSFVKFWWSGTCQVVDWRLTEIADDRTQIEIRMPYVDEAFVFHSTIVLDLLLIATRTEIPF